MTQRITCIADRGDDIAGADICGPIPCVQRTCPWSEFKTTLDWVHDACILSHLITPDYDATDLCGILTGVQYMGRVIFLAGMLPKPDMVLRELSHAHPHLTIELHQDERFITLYELGIARGHSHRN